MVEFIKNANFDFVSKFKFTSVVSIGLVVISLFGLFSRMNYGVDFRGGAEIQVKFAEALPLETLRKALKQGGFKNVSVQTIGEKGDNEFLVKVPGDEKNLNVLTESVGTTLKTGLAGSAPKIRKVDIVGPKAGASLRVAGFQAMGWALIVIMIYIGLRFDFKYSPGAIFALFHDVSIILGIFAFTGTEFTLQTVAALLAVIGYSVNDTVVIYDRVREHEERDPDVGDLGIFINKAANETLSRTILTSGTTLFVALSMYFYGGLAIRDFFFAISLGVLVGTYSSIFVAAPITLLFDGLKKKSEFPVKARA
ncbi:MAG: protein translocase subunit SecF [Bdellovibrionota bacterium]|nr:protein translocase subunit SecF [Bdellovibrionota bacterium]